MYINLPSYITITITTTSIIDLLLLRRVVNVGNLLGASTFGLFFWRWTTNL